MIPFVFGERKRGLTWLLGILVLVLASACASGEAPEPSPEPSSPPTSMPYLTEEAPAAQEPAALEPAAQEPEEAPAAELAEVASPLPPDTPTQAASPTPAPPAATATPQATAVPATPTLLPTSTEPALVPATPTRFRPTATSTPGPAGTLLVQAVIGGDIYMVNADGSGLRRLTDGGDPIWSPDGRQIAFVRWREPRGVWVINADGSGEWRVFDWSEARWPSWSPDGSRILFSRQQGGRTEEMERCFRGFCFTFPVHLHWKLGVIQPGDGDFREPSASQFSLAPMWSPEGHRIVYDDEQGLRVQSEDGSVSYLITHDARDTSPAWSPDGRKVVFARRQHDHWEVYVVDADGRNLRRLTDTPRQPDGSLGNSAAPAWSPDGRSIAYITDRSGRWEVWVMGVDGDGQKPLFSDGLPGIELEYAGVAERVLSWRP